jgi:FkbM family methyltransferase
MFITRLIRKLLPVRLINLIRKSRIYFLRVLLSEIKHKYSASDFFAQTAEDALLQRYMPYKKGFYLDIGAGHPVIGSNTFAFYKKGWHGICVDPLLENANLHKILRSRDEFLIKLVGDADSEIQFWEFRPYEYSTASQEVANELAGKSGVSLISHRMIATTPLREIIKKVPKHLPTILSIDVEGLDLLVLKSNDWSEFQPDIICIEEWSGGQANTEVSEYLLARNYSKVAFTGLSSIYMKDGVQKFF